MRYADVRRKEQKFIDCTSLTGKEFDKLVPVFEEEFQEYMKVWRLDGKKRVGRKYQTYANCPLPTPEDRLFFLLVYLKTNNLQVIHGELFQMSQGKANQWIHTLLPVLRATLRRLGDAPARSMEELARRLGQDVSPERVSLALEQSIADFDEISERSDGSSFALDLSQDPIDHAYPASNDPSNDISHIVQETGDSASPPLFAMMGPRDASSDQKMLKNRKNIIVERKRLIR